MQQHSLLISGATQDKRVESAAKKAGENSSQFDTLILDTEEDPGIEKVRDLLGKLAKKPFNSKLTSAVVLEAQNLSHEAQNLFLKTLEEPSSTSQVILTAPSEFSVLATLSSRCQKLDLGLPKIEIAEERLQGLLQFGRRTLASKIDFAENLDLEEWESLWREVLLSNLGRKSLPQIIQYLRKIQKTKEFLLKRASPKLAKINLILDVPNLD
ncbi:MAG: hypothetical protein Q8P13_02840 [bacterium]|nr:hypothetical protein [bacterium]